MPTVNETINLAARMVQAGQPQRAAEELRKSLRHHPENPDLHHELGIVCLQSGQGDQAMFHLQKAAALAPKRADIQVNLGATLNIRGKAGDAADAFRRAVAADPRSFPANLGLSSSLIGVNDLDAAAAAARAAAALNPNRPEPVVNLAIALSRLGRSGEAVTGLRDAAARMGDHPLLLTVLSNLLLSRPEATPEEIRSVNERLGNVLTRFAGGFTPLFPDTTTQGRRLRIGYLSPDVRDHAVAHFIAPILEDHDRSRFEVFLYSAAPAPDAVTQGLARLVGHKRDVAHVGDAALAQLIRSDRIDILVDLAGHTPGTRISVMAHRPAPIQLTYLGYPATTGMKSIKHQITDSRLDPEGAEAHYTESLLRLSAPALAYAPQGGSTPARKPPRPGDTGAPTFVSLAPAQRINESVLDAWAAILKAVPGSRLLLKAAPFSAEPARASFRALLSSRGVEPPRLAFAGFDTSRADHLAAVAGADIALDTFPANGLASTCDALSVGVPVVTLAGATHAGRLGLDLLTAAGAEELVASSTDDYIRIAAALAGDRQRLARYHSALPQRLASSPLSDGQGLTRRLEDAYQRLWSEFAGSVYYAGGGPVQPDLPAAAEVTRSAAPPELPPISQSDLI